MVIFLSNKLQKHLFYLILLDSRSSRNTPSAKALPPGTGRPQWPQPRDLLWHRRRPWGLTAFRKPGVWLRESRKQRRRSVKLIRQGSLGPGEAPGRAPPSGTQSLSLQRPRATGSKPGATGHKQLTRRRGQGGPPAASSIRPSLSSSRRGLRPASAWCCPSKSSFAQMHS